MANLMDLIRGTQNQTTPTLPAGGGLGGGIVATPEQIAESEAIAARLGIPVNTPVDDDGVYEQGIQVDGVAVRPRAVDQSQYLLSAGGAPDLRNTEWAQAAVEAREENDKKVQHKGMFGLKGTLRNVLGVLGDAFLVQSGNNPIYGPTRHRERMGDAFAGYTQAPRAAVERMGAVDPDFAEEMGKNVTAQEAARAAAEAARAKEIAERQAKGFGIVAGMMNADGLEETNNWAQMRPIIEKTLKTYGLEGVISVPETYDRNFARGLLTGAVSPDDQLDNTRADERNEVLGRQGDERVGIARQQAGISAQRAAEQARHNRAMEAKPRSGGSSNPTNASLAAPLLDKVRSGKRLTPAEDETLTRLGYPSDRGATKRGGTQRRAVTPQQSARFR